MGIVVAFLTVFYLPFLPFNNFSNNIHNIEKGHQIILNFFKGKKIVNMIVFQAENKQICLYTTLVSTDPQYFVPESCTGQKLFKCIFEIHIIEKGDS